MIRNTNRGKAPEYISREEGSLANVTEKIEKVGGAELAIVRGGSGKPLLMLHDELGYPGWMGWNDALAGDRQFIIPRQPGFDKSPRIDWIRSYRDLGGYYARVLRELKLDQVDVVAFSAGAYIAAEMAASDPDIFGHMALVGPMGIRPEKGFIADFIAMSMRTHLRATVADPFNTPEFLKIYGGEMSPEQFENFEDARAETARIGWEPFMFNPSLPHLLQGVTGIKTLLVWGTKDNFTPRGCVEAYQKAIPSAKLVEIKDAGHRPEIEKPAEFIAALKQFLAS
jgi:pimeloyl-ACP methyl ester carboxylesterase